MILELLVIGLDVHVPVHWKLPMDVHQLLNILFFEISIFFLAIVHDVEHLLYVHVVVVHCLKEFHDASIHILVNALKVLFSL